MKQLVPVTKLSSFDRLLHRGDPEVALRLTRGSPFAVGFATEPG